ncbi:uncharacterized protein G2W53_026102 [Senna tora]|uniref:Uncharacterized protein n=1 Tax=Senna tora TaxID=362788 RepID=A0A834TEE4_9FABA|nr:uncharacterized protein G2W53_026102 [Senna tora]
MLAGYTEAHHSPKQQTT